MDNNDSNAKSSQTGGLKLMTVFIAVLALHVLVIGGFTVYHLMSGGSDADLALDKTHKKADTTVAEAAIDNGAGDKAPLASTANDTPSTSATSVAPAPVASTPAETAPTASTKVAEETPLKSATTVSSNVQNPKPAAPATTPVVVEKVAPAPVIASNLLPPPDNKATVKPNPSISTPAPAPLIASVKEPTPETPSGPVHMPAVAPAKPAKESLATVAHDTTAEAAPAHETAHIAKKELYTVKMTDSYKKIAHAHHVTVAQLKEANHLKDDTLHTGQKLVIPKSTLLAKSGTNNDSEIKASTASLSAIPASTTMHHHSYTVAQGDTLKKIAKRFNTTTSALKQANNLDSSKLVVGHKLKIPTQEARSAGTIAPRPVQPIQPIQVQTRPAPIEQSEPSVPPAPAPSSAPVGSPELANMTF